MCRQSNACQCHRSVETPDASIRSDAARSVAVSEQADQLTWNCVGRRSRPRTTGAMCWWLQV